MFSTSKSFEGLVIIHSSIDYTVLFCPYCLVPSFCLYNRPSFLFFYSYLCLPLLMESTAKELSVVSLMTFS